MEEIVYKRKYISIFGMNGATIEFVVQPHNEARKYSGFVRIINTSQELEKKPKESVYLMQFAAQQTTLKAMYDLLDNVYNSLIIK